MLDQTASIYYGPVALMLDFFYLLLPLIVLVVGILIIRVRRTWKGTIKLQALFLFEVLLIVGLVMHIV